MNLQRLTCPCGHCWDHRADGLLPDNLRLICPVCVNGNGHTQPTKFAAVDLAQESVAASTPSIPGFELLEVLNRGGMGVIYKARQLGLNRLVALKVIAPERLGNADAVKRFKREVRAAAQLSHANIVTVYQTDLQSAQPYLAMEYIPGIDLKSLVYRIGPLEQIDACNYIIQIAKGLQHIYEQGLVHRDIKPSNLMVTPSPLGSNADRKRSGHAAVKERIKILDLGLARVADSSEGGELTRAGIFLGTPDYASPEQTENPQRVDIRSDLYSLGGTLYFLLTGQLPFPNCNIIEKLRRQLTESVPSPSARDPAIWPFLDATVRILMACNPDDRFQTPLELIDTLKNALRNPTAPLPRKLAKSASTPPPISQVMAHPGGVTTLAVSSDGKVLISGGIDETLRIWDTDRLGQIRSIANDVGSVRQACLAPGSKWAASCALRLFKHDMVVQIWDLNSGSESRRLRGATDSLRAIAISPDGRRVAAGGSDRIVRIWDVDRPSAPAAALTGHAGEINALTYLSGGAVLLSAGDDGMVRLWDASTGASRATLNADVGRVLAVAHGGESRCLAFAGETLRVLHPDGSFIQLIGHVGAVTCVAFSFDSRLIVSGGTDRTVRIWDAERGDELHCFQGHLDRVTSVIFRGDGKIVFSASADGTIRPWQLGA